MNIDQDSDIRVASIAKVRDDGSKSDEEEFEEFEGESEELLEEAPDSTNETEE